jgi:hypothetical protein
MRRNEYPPDWEQISAEKRAKGICDMCGVKNHMIIKRRGSRYRYAYACEVMRFEIFYKVYRWRMWRALKTLGLTKIILTTSHVDRNPSHNDDANLRVLCQRCHLLYDGPDNARRRNYGREFIAKAPTLF